MKFRLLLSLLVATTIVRAEDSKLFPFLLPWDDASAGPTDVSYLNPRPAGGEGYIAARDGHLYAGDRRFRIFGVNFAFGASFPTHEAAGKIASRMAKFGFNCVRFHHMDNLAAPAGIWSADMKTLDPGQLDRLDYFIAQLKKNGIYADLNLHVSRVYPGMPHWQGMSSFFKGVDNFYPPMIEMQKEYARQLLGHVNAYTHNAYSAEPAVALVEINNENGLDEIWWDGALDNMPAIYQEEFQTQWNRWLAAKYKTGDALAKAWNEAQEPLGAELLRSGTFENGIAQPWILERQNGAEAEGIKDDGGILINVTQPASVGWYIQLSQPGIEFSRGRHYTVSFRARSDAPRRIVVTAGQTHEPWGQLWSANAELTPDWKDYHLTFQPSVDEKEARLVFSNLASEKGLYWFSNVSLRTGGVPGLREGEKLGSVAVLRKTEVRANAAQRDWTEFLYDTEMQYWTGMEQFLKQDLGVHSLVIGSASGFSPASIQARLDMVDAHEYWRHPSFPHKAWDMADWNIVNDSLAGAPGGANIPSLAERRVAGKPYICTEYNASAPNTHSSEAFLILSAYAALQDWDGLFVFAYSHRTDDWDTRKETSFFDVDQHPAKLVTFPAAVSMFLRGDVSAAGKTYTFHATQPGIIDAAMRQGPWWGMFEFGMNKMLPLVSKVQLDFSPGESTPNSPPEKVAVSDTGELTWDTVKSRVLIDSPRSKAFIGRTGGEPVKLGDVTIDPKSNMQNWAAITVTDIGQHRLLVTATGYIENTGMKWKDAAHTSVGANWGSAPSLLEGIPATITLPGNASHAWALDGQGQRGASVPVNGATLEIGPQYQTLWYEVDLAP